MKGMIFLEFMTMVENTIGIDMEDDLIEATQPALSVEKSAL